MVSLVKDVESIPNNKLSVTPAIKQWYAFALNRRNQPGDRDKALEVIQQVRRPLVAPSHMPSRAGSYLSPSSH